MPFYETMMFGFRSPQAIVPVAASLGIHNRIDNLERGFVSPRFRERVLSEIHVKAIEYLAHEIAGFAHAGKAPPWPPGTDIFYGDLSTPWGRRSVVPIHFKLCFDPDEVGDDIGDAVFGIALSSRYQPSLLDMDDSCGSLEGGNDDFVWERDAREWQRTAADQAMSLIRTHIPEFQTAELIQKTEFA